jgi:hypothetical protein
MSVTTNTSTTAAMTSSASKESNNNGFTGQFTFTKNNNNNNCSGKKCKSASVVGATAAAEEEEEEEALLLPPGTVTKTFMKKKKKERNYYYDSIPLSVQPNMNETSNVLMHYTLGDLKERADMNFWLGLICLAVCSMNIVLLGLNYTLHNNTSSSTSSRQLPPPQISDRTFHLMEFWTSHFYAITEAFALVTSPKTMLNIYGKPNLLKLLLFFNVVNSLVPALLITLDAEYFERLSHNLEYVNEFTLSFITLILLGSLLKLPDGNTNNCTYNNDKNNNTSSGSLDSGRAATTQQQQGQQQQGPDIWSLLAGGLACAVGMANLALYNFYSEEGAHYLEMSFNVITALVTFWFCMDNRFVAQMEIGQILYGQHKNCVFCKGKSSDFLMQQQQASSRWRKLYGGDGGDGGDGDGEAAAEEQALLMETEDDDEVRELV